MIQAHELRHLHMAFPEVLVSLYEKKSGDLLGDDMFLLLKTHKLFCILKENKTLAGIKNI
jgi:hypothetical protein